MRKLYILLFMFTLACSEPEKEAPMDAAGRSWYAPELRNAFLDDGYDIKVQAEGAANDTLLLTYTLFSDVWARKFETNGSYDQWQRMGFTKVILSNGNKYRHEQDLDKVLID